MQHFHRDPYSAHIWVDLVVCFHILPASLALMIAQKRSIINYMDSQTSCYINVTFILQLANVNVYSCLFVLRTLGVGKGFAHFTSSFKPHFGAILGQIITKSLRRH
jgi:hypothetical protein